MRAAPSGSATSRKAHGPNPGAGPKCDFLGGPGGGLGVGVVRRSECLAARRRRARPARELGAQLRRRRRDPIEVDPNQCRTALDIGAAWPVDRTQLEPRMLELPTFNELQRALHKRECASAIDEQRDRLGRMAIGNGSQASIVEGAHAPLFCRQSKGSREGGRSFGSDRWTAQPCAWRQASEQLGRLGRERQVVRANEPDTGEGVHVSALYVRSFFPPRPVGCAARFCPEDVERRRAVGYGPRPVGVGLQFVAAGHA